MIDFLGLAASAIPAAIEGVRFVRCDRCVYVKNCERLQRCTPTPINHAQFHAWRLTHFAKTQSCDSDGGECD